ncbi:hypothetical protein [Clostridium perfringens]|nr:hypothetical protein [Clostridium perfringens]MDT7982539.1 hypothetical protein [Clostridium perfringens]MDT7985806.1 hypothetical protein [Clostridium perfringens]MDT8041132.1 hypothetical protein [Clostridium perfringens]
MICRESLKTEYGENVLIGTDELAKVRSKAISIEMYVNWFEDE